MKSTITFALAAGLTLAAGVATAETFIRAGTQEINVQVSDGKLYCTRVSDGFEMCNGMTKRTDGSWRGRKMKHPDMPGFMRFNGTVVIGAGALKIKGCALGICDSEAWTKQ